MSSGAGGAGAGKLTADDVVVGLGSSQSVAKLVEFAGTGKHIAKVEISAADFGPDGARVVDSFLFSDVLVSSLQDGSGGNQIAFDYSKFGHTHVEYDDKTGKKLSDIDTGYDFKSATSGGDGGPGFPTKGAKLDDVAGDLDYYVRFDGVGATDEWLHLGSFSMGLTNSGSVGGAGAGKTAASDVTLLLGSSKQLAELTTKLTEGTHIKLAEVEAYQSGGGAGKQLVDEFRFEDVQIASLDTANASSNVLSFDFAKYSHGHELLDAKGAATGFVSEGFDFTKSIAFNGPDPLADADKAKIVSAVEPGADLQYYMRIDGVTKDWVELDSFSLGLDRAVSSGAGGAGAGKLTADDVVVGLGSSQSVAKLVEFAGTGKHIAKVEISAADFGPDGARVVDSFLFSDVLVSSLQDGSGGNQIAFDYSKFGHTHVEYDDKTGKKLSDIDTGYDFKSATSGGDGGPGFPTKGAKLDDVAGDLDYYVRFDGVGATDEWLHLGSFSMGLTNSGSVGGAGAGKTAASDVTLLLGSSKQLAELTTKLTEGTHIKLAEVEAYQSGGGAGKQLVDEFRFEDVQIASLDTANASSNVLSFDFAKFSHGHELHDTKGAATGFVSEGFDFGKSIAFNGPDPHADMAHCRAGGATQGRGVGRYLPDLATSSADCMTQSSWAEGYVVDVGYTHGYYRELAPATLSFVGVLGGFEPPDAGRPSITTSSAAATDCRLALHAAANPHGRFIGVDFNPTHVHNAQRLARDAGIGNVRFLEKELRRAARGRSARGRIHRAARRLVLDRRRAARQIVEFIRRRLKPGGIVYVSYNCLPGLAQVGAAAAVARSTTAHSAGGERMDTAAARARFRRPARAGGRGLLRRQPARESAPRPARGAGSALRGARVFQRQLVALLPRGRGTRPGGRQARVRRLGARSRQFRPVRPDAGDRRTGRRHARPDDGRDDQGLRARPGLPPGRVHARRAQGRPRASWTPCSSAPASR